MSVTLHLGNSYSRVEGLQPLQFRKLRVALSYKANKQAAYFAGGNYPTVRYVIDSKGIFATGLLARVHSFLRTEKIAYAVIPAVRTTCNLVDHKPDFKGLQPYPSQIKASNTKYDRGIIAMPTGSGKSLVIALLVARLKVRTLIVVPNLEIKKQLTLSLLGVFNDISNITVENIDSPTLKTAKGYDCLIIDEAHHVAAKTYQKLNKTAWTDIHYRYFLTATPFRNDSEENLLFEGIAGQVIYQLSYKQAIKQGYIVPVEAYYIELPKVKTEAYTWAQVYSELVVNNQERNDIIKGIISDLNASGAQTLCLVKEIKHGDILGKDGLALFANGQDEYTRQWITAFNSGLIKTLIGTTGIIGEGIDTKPCEYVIIAGLGKAKSAFMQQVGRAVRTYPGKESAKIIIFKDKSHKFTLRHYKEQCKILKDEYGVEPIKLDI